MNLKSLISNLKSLTPNTQSLIRWLTLLTLALVAAMPLWGPGMVNTRGGGDSPFLLWRVHQLVANLRDGVFPARWMPDAAYGLGYPFFSYYAALPYYLASLLDLAGIDILTAIKLTQTLGFLFAAVASYGWFRRIFKLQAAAWLGAAAYTFAPFHLVNVYVRGDSLSEFYAFAFYPLILWAIDNAIEHHTAKSIIVLGLAYGGLIVTHTLSAAIFTPFVLLYAIFQISNISRYVYSRLRFKIAGKRPTANDQRPTAKNTALPASRPSGVQSPTSNPQSLISILPPFRRPISALAAGLLLGLALSAWYWLPALLETRYVQTATLGQGYFYYGGHFLALGGKGPNLVQPSLGFIYDTTSQQASPFAMGLVQAIFAGLGIISCLILGIRYLRSRRTEHPIPNTHYLIPFLLLATFMLTPLSKPLWDHLPVLPMVQFPWRFLSVQAFFAAMATAFLVESLPRWRVEAAAVVAGALSLAVMLPLHPDRLMINASDVTTQRLQLYELFTANIGTTITYEWLPRDVNPRPYTSELVMDPSAPPRVAAVEGELISARETAHRSTSRTWQIDAGTDTTLVFPLLYWPGWYATIDGAPAAVRPAPSSGRIALDAPRGPHTIVLQLGRTPLRLAAELTSLVAMLVCIVGIGYWALGIRFHVSRFTPSGIVIGYLAFALLLIVIVNKPPVLAASSETMDYIQMPYLHGGPVYFESKSGEYNVLNGYENTPERITAGQPISLTLDWAVIDQPLTATVALVGSGEHLFDLHAPISISQSTTQLTLLQPLILRGYWGSKNIETPVKSEHILNTPSDLPTGIYLLQVRLVGKDSDLSAYKQLREVRYKCPEFWACLIAGVPSDYVLSGAKLGSIYLRPIYVQGNQPLGNEPVIATFGDRIRLHAVQAEQQTPTQLLVKLDWSVSKPVAENYGIAVRLYDAKGDRLASIDTQPGHGFLPTTAWQPGLKITDRLLLPLPEGLPPRNDYKLEVILYNLANNLAGIGQYFQPGIALTQYARRSVDSPVLAQLNPQLALATLDLPGTMPQGTPDLTFSAGWLAIDAPATDVLARWSLVDETGGAVATSTVTLTTASWPVNAYVRNIVHMPAPVGLAAGRYHLEVTLLDAQTGTEAGHAQLDQTIEITGRPRNFDVPPLDHRLGANLGRQIMLEGYTLTRNADTLRLTLAWRAKQTISKDYTVFVHLLNSKDAIVAQYDAMPMGNAYPTSWWAAGEVVADTIALPLKDAPSGVYHLAVGMYDGATQIRLEAYGPDGQRLTADRIILPEDLRLP